MTIPSYILSPKEASLYCGLSLSTLSRLRQIQDFPEAIRLGMRRIGFIKADIDEWLEKRRLRYSDKCLSKKKVKAPQTAQDLEKIHRSNIRKLFSHQ